MKNKKKHTFLHKKNAYGVFKLINRCLLEFLDNNLII